MTDIKPALTAEEWKDALQRCRVDPNHRVDPKVAVDWTFNRAAPFHGLAALLLFGQSFGFTREDLETLDDAINAIHGPKMDALHPGVERLLDDIKDRIEALLPPEE